MLWCAEWYEAILRPSAQEPHPARPLYNYPASRGLELHRGPNGLPELWDPLSLFQGCCQLSSRLSEVTFQRHYQNVSPWPLSSSLWSSSSAQWPLISSWVERTTCFYVIMKFSWISCLWHEFWKIGTHIGFGNSKSIFFQSFCLCHKHQKSILMTHFFGLWSGFNDAKECGIKRN